LSELVDGQKGIVSGVVDHSSVFLQYLEKMNLVLGKQIRVTEQNQFDKSYQILLNETENLHISVEVAKNVLVRLI
jgi:DtxR family Mn-dependent transcriptional regulator